jgi:hypothetical protein
MRITEHVVQRVAEYAKEFTGGAFRMNGIGGDIGHGTRYIDGVRQLVWLGKSNGARKACAYYLGAIETFNTAMGREIGDLPEWLQEIHTALVVDDRRSFINAEMINAGSDANFRMSRAYGDDYLRVMSAPGFAIGDLNTLTGEPAEGTGTLGTPQDDYARSQITRVVDGGTSDGDAFYRLQVSGKVSSKSLNVTADQLSRIAAMLHADDNAE